MTREEAIKTLANFKRYISGGGVIDAKANEALDMAIEALQTDIVRCKDCKYIGKVGDLNVCRIHEISTRADDYCSRGERSEE